MQPHYVNTSLSKYLLNLSILSTIYPPLSIYLCVYLSPIFYSIHLFTYSHSVLQYVFCLNKDLSAGRYFMVKMSNKQGRITTSGTHTQKNSQFFLISRKNKSTRSINNLIRFRIREYKSIGFVVRL